MRFTKDDLEEKPISFARYNKVYTFVGGGSAKAWNGFKIPLDGRHYKCGGLVILKNGMKFRASLVIKTHTLNFLDINKTYIFYEDVWYTWDDQDFLKLINVPAESAFPFTWVTDIPLDYHKKGPFPMHLDNYHIPIVQAEENKTYVFSGAEKIDVWNEKQIPLDGRHYICGGVAILKNGKRLRASLSIATDDFDFLELDNTFIQFNKTWYRWDDAELFKVLNEKPESIYPFTWVTDIPINYHEEGPYPMSLFNRIKF